ncbi:MAG: hypothetical protein JSV46_09590 [Candidatus Aminicenantes bacterium]|nr:MAG: hypothetical protein JSV46_09590 [Candidatus Aminicenantes bacterium]
MRTKTYVLGLACLLLISCGEKIGGGLPTSPDDRLNPDIVFFTANPSTINLGMKSTLSWKVSDSTSVEIDEGIGQVSAIGSREVAPLKTTTFTLTAKNTYYSPSGIAVAGESTKKCTITVVNGVDIVLK